MGLRPRRGWRFDRRARRHPCLPAESVVSEPRLALSSREYRIKVWFPAVGSLPLRDDPSNARNRPASRLAQDPCTVMQADSPYGVSTFQAGKPPQAPRGGVQVLPPVVPPARPPAAPLQQPPPHPQTPSTPPQVLTPSQGPSKPKPKPPLPPKRDELTRLTTVKKDPVPIQRSKEDDTVDRKEERRREESLIRELEAHSISKVDYVAEEHKTEVAEAGSVSGEVLARKDCIERVGESNRKNSIESIRKELAEAVVNRRDSLTRANSNGKEELERKLLQRKDSLKGHSGQESFDDGGKCSPSSGPSSLLSNGNGERRPALDRPPSVPMKSHPNLESRISEEKEESSDSESGATADIWVRAIDSPIKKPPRAFRSNSASEDKQERFQPVHRASIDNSLFKHQIRDEYKPKEESKPKAILEKDEEKDKDLDKNYPASLPPPPPPPSTSSCYASFPIDKRLVKIGSESLPCSRPSSRAASPAAFGDKSQRPRMSAAEALGVVAKPCPRPEPAQRFKEALEFRRQSLSNLSDSKLSLGSTSRQLWSSFGECHGSGSAGEYKRHERARGQSADSRTLQRIKCDTWDPGTSSSTLSRIGKYSSAKYLAKADGAKKIDDRPKSTCNCRGHGGPRDSVGKRTFSVEELTCGEFVRAPSSTRSSFGKSPRVTFALSEDEMGATGSRGRHHDEYQVTSYKDRHTLISPAHEKFHL